MGIKALRRAKNIFIRNKRYKPIAARFKVQAEPKSKFEIATNARVIPQSEHSVLYCEMDKQTGDKLKLVSSKKESTRINPETRPEIKSR